MKPTTSFDIDWLSDQSHILSAESLLKDYHQKDIFNEPGLIWLKTSGTTSNHEKWIGLKKQAILASAHSVNQFIKVNEKDIWLNTLPLYHIGGLSILARSHLSGSVVYNRSIKPWSPLTFNQHIQSTQASLISLVPTQVYDIVQAKMSCPKTVRAVFVGGGHLTPELYKKARQLNWPLLTTYGMTEMSSQVATAELSSLDNQEYPKLKLLAHIKAKLNKDSLLLLDGPSKYTYKVTIINHNIEVQKADDYITTEDQVELKESYLNFKQRISDRVKVLGYLVDKSSLNKKLSSLAESKKFDPRKFVIQNMKNTRRENDLVVFFEDYHFSQIQNLIDDLNKNLKTYEKIQRIYRVNLLERTELGKFKSQLKIFRQ
ncbi:MAG: AMP-binding protein [Bdellovibrionales bacterium]|nr:AMP-binding protein [Bdellovibrionales bacterium]